MWGVGDDDVLGEHRLQEVAIDEMLVEEFPANDVSNGSVEGFSRAGRRWTGHTPKAWRDRHTASTAGGSVSSVPSGR